MTELPRGWVEVPLGTFATTTKNIDPARQSETVFDLYSVPAFANGLPDVVTGAEIGSTKQIVQQDDVLLCKIIPHLNRVWSVPESSGRSQIASPEWLVYRDHGCEPNYLRGALSEASFREKFLETKSGVGGSLTRARAMQVNEIPIPIAPRFEQQRIVAKVEGLTARTARARADLSRIPTLIARYKQRLLALAFSGDLTAGWRSAHSDLKSIAGRLPDDIRSKFVSTENDDFVAPYPIPFAWRWLRLPEIGDLDRGKSRHRPRNDPKLFGGPYPFVQTGDVRAANRVLTEFTITYSEFGLEQSRLWPVGTVCITIAANIAETAILGIEACFPDSVVGFLPDPGRVSGEFVEFFIRTMRSELEAFAPATAQKNINLNVLSSVRVPVPPVEEQAEIVRRIESAFGWLDRMAAHHTAAVRLMPKLDAAILTKAFRGELVPQDPTDEPTSVLLERIRRQREAASKEGRGKQLGTVLSSTARLRGEMRQPPTTSKGVRMTKNRNDPAVKGEPYLANILRGMDGSARAEALYARADLELVDFYKQLSDEHDRGWLVDDDAWVKVA